MDVRDKVVAITGAARGLGQEFARSLGRRRRPDRRRRHQRLRRDRSTW